MPVKSVLWIAFAAGPAGNRTPETLVDRRVPEPLRASNEMLSFCIYGFNGLIDEVRIYNRALSPDEIKRLYNMGR